MGTRPQQPKERDRMSPEHYPLSPSAWGAAEEVPVRKVVQGLLYSDFSSGVGTSYVRVALVPDPLSGTWRVRSEGGVIGEVSAADRRRFPDIQRIHAAGLAPTTLAGVRLDDASGLFDATVFLPPASLAVPHNGAAPGSQVLPAGDMYAVDTSTGEFTAAQLAERSPGQWIVGLQVLGEAVVVTLEGRVLGSLPSDGGAEVRPFLEPLLDDAPGTALSARAHFLAGMVGLDLAAPDSPCSPAAALPPLAAEPPAEQEGAAVTEFPDGTWAVTVSREDAVDAEDILSPSDGARPVALRAPSVDFTPTRSWSISAGNYLTEVEKVRLRRQADRRTPGARHRLAD
ncbi:hypothetical protein [uncultured Corynebacterium sp.]|uniref:hypothetical protein n=1 Tax=uncultured Corynebacterium sp. TaxID=159447 RepID=UPI002591C932|nr:hypothetical protein [uncultured Corynebacterium sp.]